LRLWYDSGVSEEPAPLRAAIVGAGTIARQHLACVAGLPGVTLVAVCDLSPATAEAAAERHGVPAVFTDHAELLDRARPDVVHVTTPPAAHFRVAFDALAAGATAIVEKPLAASTEQAAELIAAARSGSGRLLEDYNYLFNAEVLDLLARRDRGELGEVRHVEVDIGLDVGADGRAGAAGGLGPHERDFLPHLASLAHAFVGPHRDVTAATRPHEVVALVDAAGGTATLRFSAHSQPDSFTLRVHGSRMRGEAALFEPRLTLERLRGGPRPLNPLLNQLAESRDAARSAVAGVVRKVGGGPGAYGGLWELLRRTYRALADGSEPPVSLQQVEEVNGLVAAVTAAADRHA
jgi:predicted dehydrogenase